jgi:hypothetical protein
MLRIFVTFYWKLYQGNREDAETYLQRERKKRGYGSFAYTASTSARPPKSRSTRSPPPKKNAASHRVSVAAKRQLLQHGSRSREGASPAPPVNFPEPSGSLDKKSASAMTPKLSRRARRGSAKRGITEEPYKAPLSSHAHVFTGIRSVLEKTSAMTDVAAHFHRASSSGHETFKYPLCSDQDPSYPTWPLETLCSQSLETTRPAMEEKPTTATRPSPLDGQPLSLSHAVNKDHTGPDEISITRNSTDNRMQPIDNRSVKIERQHTAEVYRCKPPLDSFPPIWAQVKLLLKSRLIFTSQISLGRKCANPLNGFGAIKVVSTSSTMLSKAIYLVPFRHGEVVPSPALHWRLTTYPVVTYLNMVDD